MRKKLLLAIALPTMMACASSPAPAPDTPAQLVDCTIDQRERPPGATMPESVYLQFTVDQRVQPVVGTARFIPTSIAGTPPDRATLSEARDVLGGCVFDAALQDGEPVSSQRSMRIVLGRR